MAILSVGLLGLIIYFALSPKSSRLLKLAALIALGLIALSLVIGGIFLVIGPGEGGDTIPLPVFLEEAAPADDGMNIMGIVAFLLFFALIMGFIIYLNSKAHRKKGEGSKDRPPRSLW